MRHQSICEPRTSQDDQSGFFQAIALNKPIVVVVGSEFHLCSLLKYNLRYTKYLCPMMIDVLKAGDVGFKFIWGKLFKMYQETYDLS